MSLITMKKTEKITFDFAFERFIRNCRVKNLTPKSIYSYQNKIRSFKDFLEEFDISLPELTKEHVDEYTLWVRSYRHVNDISVNSYLRAVRAFTYYCMDNGYIERFKIVMPRAVKKTKETYSEEELRILLKKPDVNKCDFNEFKVWTFENFLLGTGVRISSAMDIRINDVDFASGLILLRTTKNRIQQYIPLSKTLAVVLTEYLEYRGGEPDDYLFCNSYGEKAHDRTLKKMVQNYNIARGIDKTSCHAFRHTFAKLSVLNGIDVFRLQKLMGHANIATTKEYVDLFGSDLATDYDKYNPLDQLAANKERIKMKR